MITAIQFCGMWIELIESVEPIVNESYPAMRMMYVTDPKDLICPDTVFVNRNHALGYVVSVLMDEQKRIYS
jgi:hypothetical protein